MEAFRVTRFARRECAGAMESSAGVGAETFDLPVRDVVRASWKCGELRAGRSFRWNGQLVCGLRIRAQHREFG